MRRGMALAVLALVAVGSPACEDECTTCTSTPDRGLPDLTLPDARRGDQRRADLPPSDLTPPVCPADKLLVLEDKDFPDGNWSFDKHLGLSSGTGSFVVSNKNAAGAPLGYQTTELKLEASGQLWVSHFYKVRLKPKDRPIASLRATLLARVPEASGEVGVGPQLVQGQKTFRAGYTVVASKLGSVTVGGGFVPVTAGDALDLGATGEEIGVGYTTVIDVVDTRRIEVDNWRLEVCYP